MVWMIRELISVIVKAFLLHLALLPLLPLALSCCSGFSGCLANS